MAEAVTSKMRNCPRCGLKMWGERCHDCWMSDNFPSDHDGWHLTPEKMERIILAYQTAALSSAVLSAGFVLVDHYVLAALLGAITLLAGLARIVCEGWHGGYEDAQSHFVWEAAQRRRTTYDAEHIKEKAADPPPLVRAWRSIVAKHGSLPGGKIGYIYVIKFDTGAIKVGRTSRPSKRISEHDRACRPFGVEIEDVWISQPHDGYMNSERILIAACSKIVTPIKKEYFRGVDFAVVVDIARELDGDPP